MSGVLLRLTGSLILAAAVCCGCISSVNENIVRVETDRMLGRFAWVDRVAVIPFDGTREGRHVVFGVKKKWPKDAGMIVSGLFANQLAQASRFQVKAPSTVKEELDRLYAEPVSGYLSDREVKEIGSALRADALILGDVIDYFTYTHWTLKQSRVAVRMEMVDAHTGKTMWKASFRLDDTGKPYDLAKTGCEEIITQIRERIRARSD